MTGGSLSDRERWQESGALGYLASGYREETILRELPDLNPEQIAACLDYARSLAEFEVAV